MNRMDLDERTRLYPKQPPLALAAWVRYAPDSACDEPIRRQLHTSLLKMRSIAAKTQAGLAAVSDIHTQTLMVANASMTQVATIQAIRRAVIASPVLDAFEQAQRAYYLAQLQQVAQAGVEAVVAEIFRPE